MAGADAVQLPMEVLFSRQPRWVVGAKLRPQENIFVGFQVYQLLYYVYALNKTTLTNKAHSRFSDQPRYLNYSCVFVASLDLATIKSGHLSTTYNLAF